MTRSWTTLVSVLVVCLAVAQTAVAQDDDTARARALFAEGTEFADHGQWQEAAQRFRATLRLRQSPAVVYNLAVALEQLGQLAEASLLLDRVLADPTTARDMKRLARRLQGTIAPRVGHVTIRLESDLAGATVRLDSGEVTADRVGQSIAVDAGTHTVTLLRAGRTVERHEVAVASGATETVTLGRTEGVVPTARRTAELGNEADERPPEIEEPGDDAGGGGILTRWWFWGLVVAVAAGATVGIVLATSGGAPDPVQGDLMPGVLHVEVP